MSLNVDGLALESQLSKLITRDNVKRLAGLLAGINPALGTVAGVLGAVLVRAAENVNAFIAKSWDRPVIPPDIMIPMNYDLALRFLRTKGLADSFAREIREAEDETDLWTERQKQDIVCSIASVMDLVLNHRDRESLVYGFFDREMRKGDYRAIWEHWEEYLRAQDELKRMLPVAEVRGLLSIAFGNNPLNTILQEAVRSQGAKGLREIVSHYIKEKLGFEVDLDSLLQRIA